MADEKHGRAADRISFLQHSYNLSQNAVKYYESLITNVRTFPALPAPTVVVQTGGTMDSRNYNATNSSRVLQGDGNTYIEASVNIGNSFNERQERIVAVERVIERLNKEERQDEQISKAVKELSRVRDELADDPEPDQKAIMKWMERAKNVMLAGILSYETVEAAKKAWELLGLIWKVMPSIYCAVHG
jgi:hypothetical protein